GRSDLLLELGNIGFDLLAEVGKLLCGPGLLVRSDKHGGGLRRGLVCRCLLCCSLLCCSLLCCSLACRCLGCSLRCSLRCGLLRCSLLRGRVLRRCLLGGALRRSPRGHGQCTSLHRAEKSAHPTACREDDVSAG